MELSMQIVETIKKMREIDLHQESQLLHSFEHSSKEVHHRMPAAFVTEELHLMKSSEICNVQCCYLPLLHRRK